ncbi:hypothetical protein BDW67DRAFT_175605 [Aspergillus spinulosporus]
MSLDAVAHVQAGDSNHITWSGPDDPENHKNWPNGSSSMIAPSMHNLGSDQEMQTEIEIYLSWPFSFSFTQLALYSLDPRRSLTVVCVYCRSATYGYLAWNLGCGFANSRAELFAFRFFAGIGGSAPLSIGGGAVGYEDSKRCKAMGVHTLGPLLGPVRWVLWESSAAAVGIQIARFLWLRECHPVSLLRKRRDRPVLLFIALPSSPASPSIWPIFSESTTKPLGISIVNYLSVALGSLTGLFLNPKFIDRIYIGLKARNNNIGKPDMGTMHWIMPDIGGAIFDGTISYLQGMQTYIIDSYQTYAASAMASCAILRNLASFAFPLFAPYIISLWEYSWGTSVLAFNTIGIGWTSPFGSWYFGPMLRAVSRYATG